jgi:hypothetical protein
MEAGDQLPLKGEVPTHLAPLKGQVHNTLTPWLELTLPPPTTDSIFGLSQHTGSKQTHQ